jgi:soluble lytic murein transglycosylase-like protein
MSMKLYLGFLFIAAVAFAWVMWTSYDHTRRSNSEMAVELKSIRIEKLAGELRYRNSLTKWVYDNSEKIDYDTAFEIVNAALANNHTILVLAVVGAESMFNPYAVSNKGAIGLGQIMYGYWGKRLQEKKIIESKRDLFGVKSNISATSHILDLNMEESKGDVIRALKMYLGADHTRYKNAVFANYVRLSMLRE